MTQLITAFTLVDITNSGVVRVRDTNSKEYNQQQNLNVLIQTIGLRTQVEYPVVTIHENVELNTMQFGHFFGTGPARVWSLRFQNENDLVWDDGTDPLGLLKQDVSGVAFVPDLDNSHEFPINAFDAMLHTNIYFTIL